MTVEDVVAEPELVHVDGRHLRAALNRARDASIAILVGTAPTPRGWSKVGTELLMASDAAYDTTRLDRAHPQVPLGAGARALGVLGKTAQCMRPCGPTARSHQQHRTGR